METERCPFNGVDCEYIPLAQKVTEQAKEIERLREDKLDALAAVESENAFYQEEIERLRVEVEVRDDRRMKAMAHANNLEQENKRLRGALKKIEYHSQDWEAIEIAHDALRDGE